MPAGGRFNGGHAATRPDWMSISSCNCQKHAGPRAALAPASVRFSFPRRKTRFPTLWKPEIFSLIKLAAQDKTSRAFLLIRRLNNNFALMRARSRLVAQSATLVPASRAYALRLRCPADSLECEDQPLPPPAMAAGQNCKAGLNLQNREQQA